MQPFLFLCNQICTHLLSILYVSKYFTHLSILQIPVLHASQYFMHLSILYFSFYAAQYLCLAISILGIIISIFFYT